MQLKPYIHLVTLSLTPPIYLTDCHRDFEHDGKTFVAGYVKINQPTKQKSSPSANDFSLMLSAVDQALVAAFQQDYKNKRCLIERVSLNDNETVNNIETWLDGDLNNYKFTDKEKTSTIKVTVGSVFSVFDKVKARNIGLKFADTINDDKTYYWGKKSPVTTTGSGGRGRARDKDIPVGGVIP